MPGHTVFWGSPRPRTSYYSEDHTRRGFQAWRADFDLILLQHARSGGVHVEEGQAVDHVRLDAGAGVTVYYRSLSGTQGQIEASFFIDASGHSGILARQGLRQRDAVFQTLAITGYWRGALGPAGLNFANTLVETYADGMVWSVPLHNGLRNVTLMVDWQQGAYIRKQGLRRFYLSERQKVPYVLGLLEKASLAQPPRAFDTSLYTSRTFASEQFLLVGDAGLFIDPLSSEGVHKAMASAITGAVVVNTILKRPPMAGHAVSFYEEGQKTLYQLHYHQVAQYYQEEGRWPDHLFWQRRSRPRAAQGTEDKAVDQADPEPGHPIDYGATQPRQVSHLRLGPGVSLERRAVVEGQYIELREVVVTPQNPRGFRFLGEVCVPDLLTLVAERGAVSDVIAAYVNRAEGRHCPPDQIRQVLARLYQEGVLAATGPA
jgi:flavin-dependent dehydrogenase